MERPGLGALDAPSSVESDGKLPWIKDESDPALRSWEEFYRNRWQHDKVAINAGQDGAWWMAVNHVLLKEFHHEQKTPYFLDYAKKYTDAPYLVEIGQKDGVWKAGQMLRANRAPGYTDVENGEWKFLMWDEEADRPKMPMGSSGFRWGKQKGEWNLLLRDPVDGSDIHPRLTFLDKHDEVLMMQLDNFGEGITHERGVPVKKIQTANGETVRQRGCGHSRRRERPHSARHLQYHAPERTYSVPKSPLRKGKRAGGHNSLTRIRMKPNLMVGGYGQFTFHFNYWGPTGSMGSHFATHGEVRGVPEWPRRTFGRLSHCILGWS